MYYSFRIQILQFICGSDFYILEEDNQCKPRLTDDWLLIVGQPKLNQVGQIVLEETKK